MNVPVSVYEDDDEPSTRFNAFNPDGSAIGKPLGQLLGDMFNSINQDLREVQALPAPVSDDKESKYG